MAERVVVVFTLLHRSFDIFALTVSEVRSTRHRPPLPATNATCLLAGGRIEKLSFDADPDNDSFVRAERHALVHILSNAIQMG